MKSPDLSEGLDKPPELHAVDDLVTPELIVPEIALPEFYSSVRKFLIGDSYRNSNGTIIPFEAHLDSGSVHDGLMAAPNELRSDTVLSDGTAWAMSPDSATNLRFMEAAQGIGYAVVVIGSDKSISTRRQSLAENAHNAHRILDIALTGDERLDPDKFMPVGDSRQAMIGFGLANEQYGRGRKAPYADLRAPCVIERYDPIEWAKALLHIRKGVMPLGSMAINHIKKGLSPLKPRDLIHATKDLPSLISGEAGKLFDASDPETQFFVELLIDDQWSQVEKWQARSEGKPNVSIELVDGEIHEDDFDGSHFGIFRESLMQGRIDRLDNLAEQRGLNGSFASVDFRKVMRASRHHLAAVEAA